MGYFRQGVLAWRRQSISEHFLLFIWFHGFSGTAPPYDDYSSRFRKFDRSTMIVLKDYIFVI